MKNELSWVWKAYRLSDVSGAQLASLVLFSLLTAIFDSVVISIFLPILVYLDGGSDALATRLPGPFARVYALVSTMIAGLELEAMLAAAICLMCFRYLTSYYQQRLSITMAAQSVVALRNRIHIALLKSDIKYHIQRQSGIRFTSVITYPQQVGGTIIMLAQLLVVLLMCSAYTVFMFVVSPRMMMAAATVFGAIFLSYQWLLARSKRISTEYNLHNSVMNGQLLEQLQGVRLIKLRNREVEMSEAFRRTTEHNLSLYSQVLTVQAVVGSTINPLLLISGSALILIAMRWWNTPLAELGTFTVALIRFLPLVGALHTLRASLHAYAPSLDLYQAALREADAERVILSGPRRIEAIVDRVRFEDVCFTYPSTSTPALHDASFDIPSGMLVAIVGRSGSGKSTIVDLMARLYDPDSGRIMIDGIPLPEINLHSLRESIALVSQDTFMFDASVRDNVSFGREVPLNDAELESVLRQAHALEFVRALPDGFDARIGERGIRLSGGQRQRLALARGLAQGPALLILDEPTSALDSESEQEIQKALESLRSTMTLVIVAHRLATIRNADLIYVVEGGRIVGIGSHDTLYEKSEIYQNLFGLQAV